MEKTTRKTEMFSYRGHGSLVPVIASIAPSVGYRQARARWLSPREDPLTGTQQPRGGACGRGAMKQVFKWDSLGLESMCYSSGCVSESAMVMRAHGAGAGGRIPRTEVLLSPPGFLLPGTYPVVSFQYTNKRA